MHAVNRDKGRLHNGGAPNVACQARSLVHLHQVEPANERLDPPARRRADVYLGPEQPIEHGDVRRPQKLWADKRLPDTDHCVAQEAQTG